MSVVLAHDLSLFEDKLDDVWDARLAGHLQEAIERFLELASLVGVNVCASVDSVAAGLTNFGCSPYQSIEFLLFRTSEFRHKNQIQKAKSHSREVREWAEIQGVMQHFQLSFQDGLNDFVEGRFNSALNHFYLAERLAKSDREKAFAKLNLMLCLENLGYGYQDKLTQLEEFYKKTEKLDQRWITGFQCQLFCLQQREALNRGDWRDFRKLAEKAPDLSPQGTYFAALFLQLSYLKSSKNQKNVEACIAKLREKPDGFSTLFRLRTLQFQLTYDDFDSSYRLCDKIERLYFWTWEWICYADVALLKKTVKWLRHVVEMSRDAELASDELVLLRLSLHWFALFAGIDYTAVDRCICLNSVRPESVGIFFEFEQALQRVLFARRDCDDTLIQYEKLRLQTLQKKITRENILLSLSEGVDRKKAKSLVEEDIFADFMTAVTGLGDCSEHCGPGIHINIPMGEIRVIAQDGSVKTSTLDSLIALVALIGNKKSVSLFEVLSECFGIKNYNPLNHDQKIAQFVLHANKILSPFICLRRRRDQITIERKEAHALTGVASKLMLQLASCREDISDILLNQTVKVAIVTANSEKKAAEGKQKSLSAGKWLKRQDFQEIFGWTRSTTCRRVSEWVSSGLVEVRGVGRAVEYCVSDALFARHADG